ncbi:MAG: phosphoenolpyruvate--protein phosphotransferase [Proteobacteria bacterium]|nr:phosphoenolpyruvate--protein phosphotransferase [Pseudomonadota bacterium]
MKRKNRDHLSLLCDIGELADLLTGSENIFTFLQRTVEMVSRHLDANVCSIYLYEQKSKELVLAATVGLNPQAVGKIRMKLGEGLVGTTLKTRKPLSVAKASADSHYKYFKEADEDRFESFLAVPIQRGEEKIGVIVVQHEEESFFLTSDINALRASASQLAGSIEGARLMMELDMGNGKENGLQERVDLKLVKGETASGGYALAPIVVYKKTQGYLLSDSAAREDDARYTLADFRDAVEMTTRQLKEMETGFVERLPESASLIFTAHFMILKDPSFINKMVDLINNSMSPPDAIRSVVNKYIRIFSSSPHAYMQEKANDVEDLGGRILRNLIQKNSKEPSIGQKRIVISKELFPSDVMKLASDEVQAIILVGGGITSHISILARSLNIPLVITDNKELLSLPGGTMAIVDADVGNIYIDPSRDVIKTHEDRQKTKKTARAIKNEMLNETLTLDGEKVSLFANINLLSEVPLALDLKAEGVGLYRTEFPFLVRSNFPTEEEQYVVYRRLLDHMDNRPVTIRTLDAGGDKILAYSEITDEDNPALGLRSIRFSLKMKEVFGQQIRAILRAGSGKKNLRIMFPMISSIDEFNQARKVVEECMEAMDEEALEFNRNPEIGMMVELPSVMETLDEFALAADFFSIGTNDFVQYMLAVDRGNKRVAEYFCPNHPSVLRSLYKIALAGQKAGIDVSVCGEMAHESEYIPFLLGIGIRSLSVNAKDLPAVQKRITGLSMVDAQAHAKSLLKEVTLAGTRKILDTFNNPSE